MLQIAGGQHCMDFVLIIIQFEFSINYFYQFILLFNLFFILFMSLVILFQLIFTFIYNIFKKNIQFEQNKRISNLHLIYKRRNKEGMIRQCCPNNVISCKNNSSSRHGRY